MTCVTYSTIKPSFTSFLQNKKNEKKTHELYKALKDSFKQQHTNFYSNIISCYENSILNNKDPAIIMLISDKKSKKNLRCITEKLLNFLEPKSENNIDGIINGKDFLKKFEKNNVLTNDGLNFYSMKN